MGNPTQTSLTRHKTPSSWFPFYTMANIRDLAQKNPFGSPFTPRKLSCASASGKYALKCVCSSIISYSLNECVSFERIPATGKQEYSCEFGSMKYYALCGFGGILSCGLTHTAVVPLDLVKCRIQVYFFCFVQNISLSHCTMTCLHITKPFCQ